ncbi:MULTISPECIES: hypothetical protein [Catenuloplanes]|uniref:Uncharacterized protein n=1 Tax=Catenuloplanes niger TaxID=587534 RepID=A0AAE4CXZ8_9ACTN|nr:hypothetical protein [Catenuloplanes niger]MDR7327133.1 hypothetical protein [Catenuloplanes niger]
MQTTPIAIPGVAGWVSVTQPALGRPAVTVNGMPAQRLQGNDFLLPGEAGTPIMVKLKRGVVEPFPNILTQYATYRTAPPLPGGLKALVLLPVLLIPFGGLLVGAIFGAPAFIANMHVSRSSLSPGRKLAAVAAIDLAAFLAFVILAVGLLFLISLTE